MTTGAIVTDVPVTDKVSGEEARPVNPRDLIRTAIAEKSDDLRANEIEAPETEEAEEETAPEVEEEEAPTAPTEEMVEIVVDGEKKTVPLSKIKDVGIRTLQKEVAADKRLEEANRILQETQQYRSTLRPPEPEAPKVDAEVQRLAQAIQYGTEDEAAIAVQEIMEIGRKNATLDPNQVASMVTFTMQRNEALERSALPPEQGGFADVMDDPILDRIFGEEVVRRVQTRTDNKSIWQTCQEVGTEVRKWRDSLKGTVKTGMEEKKEKKKTIVNLPTASAKVVAGQEEEEETPQQYIQRMAARRSGAK